MIKKLLFGLLILLLTVGIYGSSKKLPDGLNIAGKTHVVESSTVHFLGDRTFVDDAGTRKSEQKIFDEIFSMIEKAHSYILIDMFFYSDFQGTATTSYRPLSSELTDALIKKKTEEPNIQIQVMVDPINEFYGGYTSKQFSDLRKNGISVTLTNLKPLRDSNPAYSALWRVAFQWFPIGRDGGFLPNLLDAHKPKLGLGSYLSSFNFKANHRKVVVADDLVLVLSANPHDGSSAHSNTAIKIDGGAIIDEVIESERAVWKLSSAPFALPEVASLRMQIEPKEPLVVQLLSERAIKDKILSLLDSSAEGESIDVAMFYMSDRAIISALKRADKRGVRIRLLLDPNKDAFGREKNGIPNRQVAHELMQNTKGNTEIRWCDTHGEQCHSKMLIFKNKSGYSLIEGSANLTRRNLDNYNLETNIFISGASTTAVMRDATLFFDTSWNNEKGKIYSTEYKTYADNSLKKTLWYRFGEFTGMSRY